MREILSIHVGQAGNQIGFSNWELLCAEHGISRDGKLTEDRDQGDRCFSSFFSESHCGNYVPRGLFIDLEPSVIDQLRRGAYRELYNPIQLINGNDDSSGNFSRAFNSMGRLLYYTIETKLRKQIEICDSLQSILFHRSLAGGSGSGMTSMIFELMEEYSKVIRFELAIHPSPHFDSCVVGPYNSILGEHFCMEECDVGLLLDNEALFDISCDILSITHPTMTSINRILGQVNSCITASSRFNSDMFNDINAVLTNLVPYPRIHFPLVSFAPLGCASKIERDINTITDITRSVFELNHQLIKCNPFNGKYMACSLVYRGLVNTSEIYSTLSEIKSSRMHTFVDWCPTGFKVGIIDQPPLILPQSQMGQTNCSVVMMTNSSSVSAVWQRLAQRFHRLYAKRSFVHWFVGEGLEESEFCEALYNLATLAKDYEEVSVDTQLLQGAYDSKQKKDQAEAEGGEIGNPTVVINEADDNKGEDGSNTSNLLLRLNNRAMNNRYTKTNHIAQSIVSIGSGKTKTKTELTEKSKCQCLNFLSSSSSSSVDSVNLLNTNDSMLQNSYELNVDYDTTDNSIQYSQENTIDFNHRNVNNCSRSNSRNVYSVNYDRPFSDSEGEEVNLLNSLINIRSDSEFEMLSDTAQCSKCNRSFNTQSLSVHEKICRGKNPLTRPTTPKSKMIHFKDETPDDINLPSFADISLTDDASSDNNTSFNSIPKSNFVVCKTCGKTFTIHSIDKHKVACDKKAERELKEQEAQRKHDAGPTHVGRLPGVVCYICGRNFGTTSIDIHEKLCLEKFRKQNNELPKKERRPEPVKPQTNKELLEQMVKEKKLEGHKEYTQQAAMNDLNAAAYNQNLVPCPLCQRTFNPDALKFHTKACTFKHPSRKVGEVTAHL